MVAIYGQLLVPNRSVEYLIPYSSILELYEMRDSTDPIMLDRDDDAHVKKKIGEMIEFFENPFNKKKIERIHSIPWRKSPPLLVNGNVVFTVVNAVENAQYGEVFDPIETELILTSIREQVPLIIDQIDFIHRVFEEEVPVQVYDIEDYEFALEHELPAEDWKTP